MRRFTGENLLYLLLLLSRHVEARGTDQTTSHPDNSLLSNTKSASPSISTCRTGTVNYITHTLPQQCVTSSRPPANSTSSTTSFETTTTSHEISLVTEPTASTSAASTASTESESIITIKTSSTVTVDSTTHAADYQSSNLTQPPSSSTPAIPTSIQPATSSDPANDADSDSALDNANFLSFDEWKKQNLAKAGQSPEHVGQHRSVDEIHKRTRPGINNALDVLGEDSEIELDFTGFGAHPDTRATSPDRPQGSDGAVVPTNPDALGKVASQPGPRNKDAGKTCKERTNYASFDCAATVLKSNKECKSGSSVLVENKDSYMLNVCSAPNKFFIVELCDDILIDTIVLANYEFFSSIFRTFRLSVSDRYPVKVEKWRELGVFEARNTRDVQAFLVEQPLIWARYVRVEILSHYGNEYYCPVSLLRVHGTTMMEEFRHQEDIAKGDYPEEVAGEEVETHTTSTVQQEPDRASEPNDRSTIEIKSSVVPAAADSSKLTAPVFSDLSSTASAAPMTGSNSPAASTSTVASGSSTVTAPSSSDESSIYTVSTPFVQVLPEENDTNGSVNNSTHVESKSNTEAVKSSTNITSLPLTTGSSHRTHSSEDTEQTISVNDTTTTEFASTHSSSSIATPSSQTASLSTVSNNTSGKSSSESVVINVSTQATELSKRVSATVNSAQPVPSTQESFFKSIHKRLQMLESNATLSLQYIEEQSRILRDAFSKVEKRQIRKTETFLETLNATVLSELQGFRTQYDQLWQSTIIELESHREQYQQEILAVSARLNIVAEELLFQKRMVIVQSTLLMLCLGLVLFARSGTSTLEVPLIQQMINKSQHLRRASFYSPPISPSPDRPSPPQKRSMSGYWPRSGGRSNRSETSGDELPGSSDGPQMQLHPPTPPSDGLQSEVSDDDEENFTTGKMRTDDVAEEESDAPLETQSSPATPTGTREQAIQAAEGSLQNGTTRSPVVPFT